MSLGTVHSAEDEEGAVENLPHIGGDGIKEASKQNVKGWEERERFPMTELSLVSHELSSMVSHELSDSSRTDGYRGTTCR